jgi:hypothetical protein
MLDGSSEHVSDRLNSAVWVPGKTSEVVFRDIIPEVVKQEEGIEVRCIAEAERAAEMYAGAFESRFGLDESLHWPDGHANLSSESTAVAAAICSLGQGYLATDR